MSESLGSEVVSENGEHREREGERDPPPMPRYPSFNIRKGTFHASLDFIKALSDISSGLVHVFPLPDRKKALQEVQPPHVLSTSSFPQFIFSLIFQSLSELNAHLATLNPPDGTTEILPHKEAILADPNPPTFPPIIVAGVCIPIGRSLLRVAHLVEEEAVLLSSRERVPFMLFLEVLSCDNPR